MMGYQNCSFNNGCLATSLTEVYKFLRVLLGVGLLGGQVFNSLFQKSKIEIVVNSLRLRDAYICFSDLGHHWLR